MKIVEIRNTTVYRGRTEVFRNLSLDIAAGSHTVILGPNGAGKSTLLMILTREIYPLQRRGSYIKVLGQKRWNVWDLRRHLGIVSQDLQQHYLGDVRGINVILSGFYSGMDIWGHQHVTEEQRKRAREIMDLLELASFEERRFAQMSTGEQRRFLLGRALVHDPDVLVLDEPTSGLDVKACFQYLKIVRSLIDQGKFILLVTHHIHEIPPEISHVVMLKSGRIFTEGDKTDVLTGENLTRLFDTPVELVHSNGYYQAMPGNSYKEDRL
jgi:iron complex transport system ATP-binding protein